MKDFLNLIGLFRPYMLWMLCGIFVSLISTLASITLMAASGWFITAMGLAGVAGVTINYFTPAAIIRACAILRTGGRYAERLITHEATFRLIAHLRVWFYERLAPLAPAALGKSRSGDILGRMRGDIDTLERFYLGFLVPFFVAIFSTIIIVLVLSFFDTTLAVIVAGFLILGGFIIPIAGYYKTQTPEELQVDQEAAMRSHFSETMQGMGEFLIYDAHHTYSNRIDILGDEYAKNLTRLGTISTISQNLTGLLTGIALVITILIAIPLIETQQITPPDLALLALFTLAAFDAVSAMPVAFQSLGAVKRSARRIFEIAEQKPVIRNPDTPQTLPALFSLGFDDVSFSYGTQIRPVLENITFSLEEGEKIAIVGPTGSGKSSLVNLMLRFWQPDKGRITLGGVDLSAFDLEKLRSQFAVMPQRPYIFASTLRDNLIFANPKASQADLDRASMQAGLSEFIASLPKGYDSFIGENGRTLSGGQIKRLALARALLKNAPCLVLDEPGEGLDYTMEQDILNRVIESLEGKSLILITHRSAGLSAMDRILTLEGGRVQKMTNNSEYKGSAI